MSKLDTKAEELARDYCVNDGFARKECDYDRDRRHYVTGFKRGVKELSKELRENNCTCEVDFVCDYAICQLLRRVNDRM